MRLLAFVAVMVWACGCALAQVPLQPSPQAIMAAYCSPLAVDTSKPSDPTCNDPLAFCRLHLTRDAPLEGRFRRGQSIVLAQFASNCPKNDTTGYLVLEAEKGRLTFLNSVETGYLRDCVLTPDNSSERDLLYCLTKEVGADTIRTSLVEVLLSKNWEENIQIDKDVIVTAVDSAAGDAPRQVECGTDLVLFSLDGLRAGRRPGLLSIARVEYANAATIRTACSPRSTDAPVADPPSSAAFDRASALRASYDFDTRQGALRLAGTEAAAQRTSGLVPAPSGDEVLSLICAPGDIHPATQYSLNCEKASAYDDDRDCNVEVSNDPDAIEGRFLPGKMIVLVHYESACEGHMNGFGGYLVMEAVGQELRFLNYVPHDRESCNIYSPAAATRERLFCSASYTGLGHFETWVDEIFLTRSKDGKVSLKADKILWARMTWGPMMRTKSTAPPIFASSPPAIRRSACSRAH